MSSITDVKEEHDENEDGDERDESDEEVEGNEEMEGAESDADISLQSVRRRITTSVVSSPPSTVINSYISPTTVESVESSQAEPIEDYNLSDFHQLVELIEKLFPNIDDNFVLTLRRDGNILDFECDGETKSITLI
jgi:hypothetical protein